MDYSMPGCAVHHQLPVLAQTHVHRAVMPSNYLIPCRPLLLPSFFSSIRVCYSESVLCIRWPKYWSFSFSISPSNEYSGLISLKIDWLDLLAGIEPLFPALAGRFLFTVPPGKSTKNFENQLVCLGS